MTIIICLKSRYGFNKAVFYKYLRKDNIENEYRQVFGFRAAIWKDESLPI